MLFLIKCLLSSNSCAMYIYKLVGPSKKHISVSLTYLSLALLVFLFLFKLLKISSCPTNLKKILLLVHQFDHNHMLKIKKKNKM